MKVGDGTARMQGGRVREMSLALAVRSVRCGSVHGWVVRNVARSHGVVERLADGGRWARRAMGPLPTQTLSWSLRDALAQSTQPPKVRDAASPPFIGVSRCNARNYSMALQISRFARRRPCPRRCWAQGVPLTTSSPHTPHPRTACVPASP